jgi:hypothetical protein
MAEPAPPPAALVVAAGVVGWGLAASALNVPNDLFWHLAIAREIAAHGFPRVDPFAFSTSAIAWSPPEWLGELAFGGAYALGGLGATAALALAAIAGCFFFVGRAASRIASPAGAAIALVLFAWPASVHLPMRPLVLGDLLLVVLIERMFALRAGDARGLAWLPLLFALWSNVHPSWPIGLAILWMHALVLAYGAPIATKLGLVVEAIDPAARRALLRSSLLAPIAVVLRPDGIDGALYPFVHVIGLGDRMREIVEWFPPDLAEPVNLALVVLLAVTLVALLADRAKVPALDLALVLLGAAMALRYQRFLPLASFLCAPVLARALSRTRIGSTERPSGPALALALALALPLALSLAHALSLARPLAPSRDAFPLDAVAYARAHPIPARAFNTFEDGGYLLWSLPDRQVFIDSRFDLYARAGVFDDYLAIRAGERIAEILDRYAIDAAFVPTIARDENFAALEAALPSLGFTLVHQDDATHLWTRETRAITSLHP